jgi:hypothetical protein
MSESYTAVVRRLAEVTARVDAQRAEADSWYERQCAAADRAVRDAELVVRQADAAVSAARAEVEAIDAEVGHLWGALGARLGAAAARLGAPPTPARGAAADPATLLDGVRDLLDRAKRPGELPGSVQPLLAVFGVLGAAAAAALGAGARMVGHRHGGDLAAGLPVLALVVTLLGPFVGLAPARLLADRRQAALGPRPVAVVLIAGLTTTAALFALWR